MYCIAQQAENFIDMTLIVFEFLSSGGVWTQCGSTSDGNPNYVSMRLNQLHKQYNTRVRARYANGGIIDLIG